MKRAWMVYVVAVWLWFGSRLCQPYSYGLEEDNKAIFVKDKYPTVDFTVVKATVKSYKVFIGNLRDYLANGEDVRRRIRVMRPRDEVPISERFVLVRLSNYAGYTITLAVDVTNAYVVGFRVGDNAYTLEQTNSNDAMAVAQVFSDATHRDSLQFTGSYVDLQQVGGQNRENIELGMTALETAITSFYGYSQGWSGYTVSTVARSFIVCIQMVSEAARYGYIVHRICQSIESGLEFTPQGRIISYETNWDGLSTAIQESSQTAFPPVQVQDDDYQPVQIDNIRDTFIYTALALMIYKCPGPRSFLHHHHPDDLIIKPVVSDDICTDIEPLVRIFGPNGLCADVRDGSFHNGNSVQLWACKSNSDPNQLWVLKRDGTIRSPDNTYCLTIYGYTPGDYVMIYTCDTAVTAATLWQVWDNGTIINPISGLVLTAKSTDARTTLTGETNIYSTSQAWVPSYKTTQPLVASIVGLNGLCLQLNGNNVWLEECYDDKNEQKWAIYADGSIRPQQNRNNCLTCNADKNLPVNIASCVKAGSSGQRWVFEDDQTIWNLQYGMVLDVKQSDPSLHTILIWPYTGNPNQQWFPLVL